MQSLGAWAGRLGTGLQNQVERFNSARHLANERSRIATPFVFARCLTALVPTGAHPRTPRPFRPASLVRTDRDSHLVTFLRTILPSSTIEALIEDYRIGVARNGATIFFQLDIEGRCRTGKVMKYDPETGHRIKDPDTPSRITWVHSLMRQAGQLPASWNLTQCLFGEHLLKEHPDKPVALVESEKTAVICAGLMPKYVWLATGGKSCVNDRLLVLSGHKVVAFPDVDGYQEWIEKLAKYPELDITVSPLLQQSATPEDMEAHIDIADWLIRTRCKPVAKPAKEPSITFLKTARYIDPAYHAELEALITDFELELI